MYDIKSISAKVLLLMAVIFLPVVSCVDEEEYDDSPDGNFEALWKIMDEHYCFFDYKNEQYGLDWDAVYDKYKVRIDKGMTNSQLFEVLGDMVSELRDGHVNISSAFDLSRNWSWQEDYPSNVSDTLISKYLGTDYLISCGIRYRILDDNIGYVYIPSFQTSIGSGNVDNILRHLLLCRGLIIDIRGNSGGQLDNAEIVASHFVNEETLVGYLQHKTGPGHSEFSEMQEQILKPSKGMRWQKKVALITNREVYSAANEFTKYLKCCDNVIQVGDQTGGGAGMPFSSELPNGWTVRFSACPMYDRDRQSTEFGIAPDYDVSLDYFDFLSGRDTLIEFAREILAR